MKKHFILILAVVIILVLGISFVVITTKTPPLAEINQARKKLTEAEANLSLKYASELFISANIYYDSAMSEWKKENERFFLIRDYDKVAEHANKAFALADKAIVQSKSNITNTGELLGIRIDILENQLKDFKYKYGHFPFNDDNSKELIKTKILLSEAIIAFKQTNYQTCTTKLDSAEVIINSLNEQYEKALEDYFQDFDYWQHLVKGAITNSRKNKTHHIIVDKFARACHVYKNGVLLQTFDIELGVNWMGHKKCQGDKSTPEGNYKITSKKSNGSTKYYKAFLLNYPNEDDKKRFIANKKNGTIDKDAQIGNLIEIHGNGGKGVDWTDGCISLTDNDMDKLFALCKEGSWVTIVGSMKPLNEIFSNIQ
jgi:L,D-peptidoglycan transpeptidase YkuD (ErfK/YbiS/YcfS/YnhG family)